MISKHNSPIDYLQYINLVTQLGLIVVATLLVGGFIGFCVDRFLGIGPIFIIIFGIMGLGGGFVSAYKLIIKSLEDDDKKSVERDS